MFLYRAQIGTFQCLSARSQSSIFIRSSETKKISISTGQSGVCWAGGFTLTATMDNFFRFFLHHFLNSCNGFSETESPLRLTSAASRAPSAITALSVDGIALDKTRWLPKLYLRILLLTKPIWVKQSIDRISITLSLCKEKRRRNERKRIKRNAALCCSGNATVVTGRFFVNRDFNDIPPRDFADDSDNLLSTNKRKKGFECCRSFHRDASWLWPIAPSISDEAMLYAPTNIIANLSRPRLCYDEEMR